MRERVVRALREVVDNAMYLPDGNAQFPSHLGDELGAAMVALSEWEEEEYGADRIHRWMLEKSLPEEKTPHEGLDDPLIGIADELYSSIFHEVVIPGAIYRMLPNAPTGTDYCPQEVLERAREIIRREDQ